MSIYAVAASVLFVCAYLFIALEHKLRISKSALALGAGGAIWLFVALNKTPHFREELSHTGSEVFEIVVFLLAAMSLVEILIHYNFFDLVRGRLYKLKLGDGGQFLILSILAFFLSAFLDNLTATIVMIQIARRFFTGKNLLIAVASIVINANAGGAWSPIGDVTTIMLWIAQKFSAAEIITQAFFPSLTLGLVSTLLLYRQLRSTDSKDRSDEIITDLKTTEKIVISATFASFLLPIIMNTAFRLPPYLGLLIGLGVVWLLIDIFKQVRPHKTHLEANLEKLIQKSDLASIKFFIGILLAVGGLHSLGVLEQLSHTLYGSHPDFTRLMIGNVGLGLISAVLDNVPLAAISLQVLNTTDVTLWVLLAVTLGTGGSLFVIGSAAGVVAMGMVKELTFLEYAKIATIPALLGFLAALGTWSLQVFAL